MRCCAKPQISATFSYPQQATIAENVRRYASKIKAKSLLDIGAGSPSMAMCLSRDVQDYLAVEQNAARARKLRQAGLNVVQGRFPVLINTNFDLVLSSHSLPEENLDEYEAFILSAWRRVSARGLLLIVTFKGSGGAVKSLREEIGDQSKGASLELQKVIETMSQLASVKIERVNSYAQSSQPEDIVSYFHGWICSSAAKRRNTVDALRHIVETRYKISPHQYVFPTEHLFISCNK